MKKDAFNYSITKTLSAVNEVIDAPVNRKAKLICMQCLSVKDITTGPAQIDFGYKRGNNFVALKSALAVAADQTVAFETTVYLSPDDIPAVYIGTGVVGDQIRINVSGYVLYDEEAR